MASDPLDICNEALVLLGENPIDDLDSALTGAIVAKTFYRGRADSLMAAHPWVFNRALVDLSRLSAAPPAASGYAAQYQLPNPCYRIVCPYVDGRPLAEWGVAGQVIYLDAEATETVALEYHTRCTESLWPPEFRRAVMLGLAADMAIPITEDPARAKLLNDLLLRQLAEARHKNATEKPAIRLRTGRLAARRSV